jgi:hypothetical protein
VSRPDIGHVSVPHKNGIARYEGAAALVDRSHTIASGLDVPFQLERQLVGRGLGQANAPT